MNEETKSPTTSDAVTEQAKGRCAPAPGSEVRCNPALNHTIRRVYQPDPFEPVECICQNCGKAWRENHLGEILPPNDQAQTPPP